MKTSILIMAILLAGCQTTQPQQIDPMLQLGLQTLSQPWGGQPVNCWRHGNLNSWSCW